MTKSEVVDKARSAGAFVPGKVIRLDFAGEGSITLDGNANQVAEDAPAGASDATIHMSWEDFTALAKGQLNPMTAFMSGRIRLDGDMGVAMQLQSVFSRLTA